MIKKAKKYIIIFIIILSIFFIFWKDINKTDIDEKQTLQYQKIKEITQTENLDKTKNNMKDVFNSMLLAKKHILNNELDQAFIKLNNCLKYTNEENLKNILKLRMAKIKIEQNEYQVALSILNTIQSKHWINIIENVKGDIFIKQNKETEALECWKKSLLTELSNASKEIIKMKMNELK